MQVTQLPPYVYGIQGIADLFHVAYQTAWKYSKTWLAPAIMRRGTRKIICDTAKAIELFNEVTPAAE